MYQVFFQPILYKDLCWAGGIIGGQLGLLSLDKICKCFVDETFLVAARK